MTPKLSTKSTSELSLVEAIPLPALDPTPQKAGAQSSVAAPHGSVPTMRTWKARTGAR
jgi:hypothetical protein